MKKIIAAIIRAIMPKAIREHEESKRIHNANVLQSLLNAEHEIRDAYNNANNTVYTTAKALDYARATCFCPYNRHNALKKADFR